MLHRADQFDIDVESRPWAGAFHFRVELEDSKTLRTGQLNQASGTTAVDVNSEFEFPVVAPAGDGEANCLRIELWDSSNDDDEIGFAQMKMLHSDMPNWIDVLDDEAQLLCRLQLSIELDTKVENADRFEFEDDPGAAKQGTPEATLRAPPKSRPPSKFVPGYYSLVPARLPTLARFSTENWLEIMTTSGDWARGSEMPGATLSQI